MLSLQHTERHSNLLYYITESNTPTQRQRHRDTETQRPTHYYIIESYTLQQRDTQETNSTTQRSTPTQQRNTNTR